MQAPKKAPEVNITEGASSFCDTAQSEMQGWSQPPETVSVGMDRPPAIVGFEIERLLGRGGMGVVYLANQVRLRRQVALKLLTRDIHLHPEALTRFQGEAEAAGRLSHSNIIPVFEVGDCEGLPFLAMEYAPGGSLADALAGTPLQPRHAAELVAKLAEGVQHAHDAGIVHRDLKPANVLFGKPIGEKEKEVGLALAQPRISDFGLAKVLDNESSTTRTGQVLGTPSYMAPEQAAGHHEIGPAVDIYALGAILYEAVSGRPPFKGVSWIETTRMVAETDPVSPRRLNPAVPRDLETVCLKCLEKKPERRYPSAAALGADLRRFIEGHPVLARPVGPAMRAWKYTKRHPGISGLGVVAVSFLLILIVGGWITNRRLEWERNKAKANLDDAVRGVQLTLYLADRLTLAGQYAEGEKGVREVIAFVEPLLHESPQNPTFREMMARAQHFLGRNLADQAKVTDLDRLREAEAADRRSIELFESLCNENSNLLELKMLLANTKNNLAAFFAKEGDEEKSTVLLLEAEGHFRELIYIKPDAPEYKAFLANTINTRAVSILNNPNSDQQALAKTAVSLDEAIQLEEDALSKSPGHKDWLHFLSLQLDNLAETRAKLGDHTGACDIARKRLLPRFPGSQFVQFRVAVILALSAKSASIDQSLSFTARKEVSEKYSSEAMDWLRKLDAMHLFRDPAWAEALKSEKDLEFLKNHADFQQILQNAAPPPKSQ